MGGYKAKLKSKIKSKLKAKFSSSSKLEKPSTPDIKRSDVSRSNEQISKELQSRQGNAAEPTSVTRKVDPEQTLERNPNAHKGSFGNTFFMNGRIQQFKNNSSWGAVPTIKQEMAQAMAKDANATHEERQKIWGEETKRFNTAHLNKDEKKKLDSVINKLQDLYVGVDSYRKYSETYYCAIMNTLARTGKPPKTVWDNGKELSVTEEGVKSAMDAWKAMSKDMEEGSHSRLQKDRIVYRGVGGKSYTDNVLRKQLGIGTEVTGEELNRKLKGAVLFDKAFTSTTLDPSVAETFAKENSGKEEATILQIYAHKGLKSQFLAPIRKYGYEEELLVDQNTPLRILDVTMEEDPETGIKYRLVKAELLSFFAGSHRARVSNNYDVNQSGDTDLTSRGSISQTKSESSSGEGSEFRSLIKVSEKEVE